MPGLIAIDQYQTSGQFALRLPVAGTLRVLRVFSRSRHLRNLGRRYGTEARLVFGHKYTPHHFATLICCFGFK